MPEDKRRFTRVSFSVKAELTANNVLYIAEEITNLSVGGCLLPIEADLEPGTPEFHRDIQGEIQNKVEIGFARLGPCRALLIEFIKTRLGGRGRRRR